MAGLKARFVLKIEKKSKTSSPAVANKTKYHARLYPRR